MQLNASNTTVASQYGGQQQQQQPAQQQVLPQPLQQLQSQPLQAQETAEVQVQPSVAKVPENTHGDASQLQLNFSTVSDNTATSAAEVAPLPPAPQAEVVDLPHQEGFGSHQQQEHQIQEAPTIDASASAAEAEAPDEAGCSTVPRSTADDRQQSLAQQVEAMEVVGATGTVEEEAKTDGGNQTQEAAANPALSPVLDPKPAVGLSMPTLTEDESTEGNQVLESEKVAAHEDREVGAEPLDKDPAAESVVSLLEWNITLSVSDPVNFFLLCRTKLKMVQLKIRKEHPKISLRTEMKKNQGLSMWRKFQNQVP